MPELIVCERRGRWAVSLRRAHADAGGRGELPLCETRSLAECLNELARAPESMVALELSRHAAPRVCAALMAIDQNYPRARVMVFAERDAACWEWLTRELGAVAFVASPRDLRGVVRMRQRHAQRGSVREPSTARRVWSTLPWSTPPRSTSPSP